MSERSLPERVIEAFGGPTKTAEAVGAPITTVASWRESGKIPRWRFGAIRAAAKAKNVALPDDFPQDEAA